MSWLNLFSQHFLSTAGGGGSSKPAGNLHRVGGPGGSRAEQEPPTLLHAIIPAPPELNGTRKPMLTGHQGVWAFSIRHLSLPRCAERAIAFITAHFLFVYLLICSVFNGTFRKQRWHMSREISAISCPFQLFCI